MNEIGIAKQERDTISTKLSVQFSLSRNRDPDALNVLNSARDDIAAAIERRDARIAELEALYQSAFDQNRKAQGRIRDFEATLAVQGAGGPVAKYVKAPFGNFPQLVFAPGYKAKIGDRFQLRPSAAEPDTLQLIDQSYERMRHDGRQFAAEQAEAAAKIADLTKCLAECEGALECCGHPIEQTEALKDAALEVLEAAKGLLTSMATRPSCQDGLVRNCKCRACASNRLRAAIASAEGAQS